MLVAVRYHRAAPVPTLPAHDVDLLGQKRVRGAHDRADVHVVFKVLNSDMERVPARIQICDDRVQRPVTVGIDNVSGVAVFEVLRVVARIIRPLALPGAHTVAALHPLGRALPVI